MTLDAGSNPAISTKNAFRFRVRSVSKADESDEDSGKCS